MSELKRFTLAILIGLTSLFSLSCAKVQSLAESVELPQFSFVTSSLLPAVTGQYYLYQISVGGGAAPYTLSLSSGSLPSGLTLDAEGLIKGTPAADAIGTYNIEIQATDGKEVQIKKAFQLVVSQALSIATSTFPVAQLGSGYLQSMTGTGGSGVYTWSATGLPVGLTLASSTGVLSGIPITAGNYAPVIRLEDANGLVVSKAFTLVVATALDISNISLVAAAAGDVYAETLVASGGVAPYSFSITSGSLPQGLTLSAGGVISGTVAYGENVRNAVFNVTFQLKDSLNQVAVKSLSISVLLKPIILKDTEKVFRPAMVGLPYSEQLLVAGGKGALTFSATNLPSGLTLNANTGKISGTPLPGSGGTHTVNFQVTDSNGFTVSRAKRLIVRTVATNGESEGGYMTNVGWYNAAWAYPRNVAVGDLNSDGKNDIVYASWDSMQLIVLLGNGTGAFTKYAIPALGRLWGGLAIADVTGDGFLDVVASRQTANLTVFKGDNSWTNSGAIVTQDITLASEPLGVSISDINGDGKKDIAAAVWGAAKIAVFLNCGASTTVSYAGNPTAACGTTGQAVINLHAAADIAAGTNPRGVELIDINADGKQDVVFTSYGSSYIGIALGNANGTFGAPNTTSIISPRQLKVVDMDADGKLDIVTSTNAGVSVLLGNGLGGITTILSGTLSDLGGTPEFLDVADINGDSAPDVAMSIGGTYLNQLAIFRNDGTGQLMSRSVGSTTFSAIGAVLAPMFTGSTRPDFVFAAGTWVGLSRVVVLKNSYTGTGFDLPNTYWSNPPNSYGAIYGAPVAGDLNGDGYMDVVNKIGGAASISFGQADGGFTLSDTTIPTGDTAANWWFGNQMALADLNLDGNLDMASANWNNGGAGTVTLLMGNGDGSFGSQSSYAINKSGCLSSLGARTIDFADFNRDGFIDMVVGTGCATSPGSQIYLYFGYGDGTYDIASPLILVGNGSYADYLKAVDFDRDGKMDIIVANNNAYLQVYRGNGDGSFINPSSLASLGIATSISQLAVEDFNNDGYLDVAACAVNGTVIAVALLNSSGTVASISSIAGNVLSNDYNNQLCSSLVAIDWNSDGKMDILQRKMYENTRNNQGGGGIHIYYGVGNGTFNVRSAPMSEPNVGPYSQGIMAPVDLNQDGTLDLLIGTISTNSNWGTLINRSQ